MTTTQTRKTRYQTDPEFREHERARARDYYQRTKTLKNLAPGPKPKPLSERFWAKVERRSPDECWPWLGASGNGTRPPTINDAEAKDVIAYRVAYDLHYGEIPDKPIRHTCGNNLCMNPTHLFAGTMVEMAEELARQGDTTWLERWSTDLKVKSQRRTRQYYEDNREAVRQYEAERQMRNKIRAVNYLGGKCMGCGFSHPAALQFHHRDPANKSFSITTKELSTPKKRPWETVIVPELDKCDLLCANCHFLHHSKLSALRVRELCDDA